MHDLDAAGACPVGRRHRDGDEARRGPVIELLLDADDGRARGGAFLQRAIGALEAGVDDDRIEDLVTAAVEPVEQTDRAMLPLIRAMADAETPRSRFRPA
jgi:hypothetical protein